MAKVKKKLVVTTRGKDYGVGDGIIMKLKNKKVLVGIIENISFIKGRGWQVYLNNDCGAIEIPADLIED